MPTHQHRLTSPHYRCAAVGAYALAVLVLFAAGAVQARADVVVGPWVFDDAAFADNAVQLEPGLVELLGGASDLNDALGGFSPTKGLANIGSPDFANHFQLAFTDVLAVNGPGPDLVFFDARFSPDHYEITVRPLGGSFTAFLTYETGDFIDTGLAGPTIPPADRPDLFSTLFGLPIELDDFGLPAGTMVDAIHFRALPLQPEIPDSRPQGDPVMAAALNAVLPVPVDIKPRSCPNPLNYNSGGVLPVAILGTQGLDVTLIDPATVTLGGIPVLSGRSRIKDVATPVEPFVGKADCYLDCTEAGPDGVDDLTLKFDVQEIVAAVEVTLAMDFEGGLGDAGELADGDCLVLVLEGELFDGTAIVGEDVVIVVRKGER